MDNEDRIRQWRETRSQIATQAKERRLKRAEQRSQIITAARYEKKEQSQRRQSDVADVMVPTSQEAAEWQVTHAAAWAGKNRQRARHQFLIFAGPVLFSVLYAAFFLTPLYQSKTIFSVNSGASALQSAPTPGLVGIFPGASLTDGFKVKEFLHSQAAMAAIEDETDFLKSFKEGRADIFTRPLTVSAFGIDEYDFYKARVRSTIDLRSGLVTMRVQGISPEQAAMVSDALLEKVRVKTLDFTAEIDADQLVALETSVSEAKGALETASATVLAAQGGQSNVSPAEINVGIYQLISSLELQLAEAEREHTGLLEANLVRSPLLPGLVSKIENLQKQIQQQRSRLNGALAQGTIAAQQTRLENLIAQRDIAQQNLQFALTAFEEARQRVLANRRYLVLLAGPERSSVPMFGRSAFYIGVLAAMLSILTFIAFKIIQAWRFYKGRQA